MTHNKDAPPSAPVGDERAAYEAWFSGEQGKPYDGCWQFGWAAWNHRAALTQQPAQAAPGWKLVPVKATEAMQEAFNDWRPKEDNKYAGAQSVSAQDRWEFRQRYAAMLAATPPGDDAAGGGHG